MDRFQFPPEFQQAIRGGGRAVPPSPVGMDPMQLQAGQMDPLMASMGAQQPPMAPPMGPPPEEVPSPSYESSLQSGAVQIMPSDPVLSDMMSLSLDLPRPPAKKKRNRKPIPEPDAGKIVAWANHANSLYMGRNQRMARDVGIYRQHEGGTPLNFDELTQTQFLSAAMSNLVNRLANMMGGLEPTFDAPFRDQETEEAAQSIENFSYWSRDHERRLYARNGGNPLQRDEFFYLLLHGAVVSRVLPDLTDDDYPWATELLDPSTCYPSWGGQKEGMVQMVRRYTSSVSEVIGTYAPYNVGLEASLMRKLNVNPADYGEFLNQEMEIVEYWDKDWRWVGQPDGTDILPVKKHGYGVVPFIYITAVGEPKNMQTPDGAYQYNNKFGRFGYTVSRSEDMEQKGVSVLHYLINTHRLKEALMTLLYTEVVKASNPPTMRYRAPQLMGQDVPDIDYNAGGTNAAFLGLEKVEGLPTSPAPTDLAPVMQGLDADWYGGSLNPAAQGQEMGANASGYSLDTLIAAAKELILPYLQAFENYLGLKIQMQLEMYETLIADMVPISVPQKSLFGSASGMMDLTMEALELVGTHIAVRLDNITDQNLPQRAQTATNLQQAGFWSQQAGMNYVGVKNPGQMLAQIQAEKALQHPLIQDIYAIPNALEKWGATDLADIWMQFVAFQTMMMSGMMPGQGMGGMDQGGGGGMAAPNMGGMTNPGRSEQLASPGGPAVGQGRTS